MTNSQKLAVRLSEIRQRLNEISGLADNAMTDEIRAETDRLTAEYRGKETQHRAAIVAEGEEEAEARGAFGNGDGEPAEVRALLDRITIGDYLSPAAAGGALMGAPAELAAALSLPTAGAKGGVAVPWTVLGRGLGEQRAAPERRAFTTTGQNDGPEMQRPILQRLFGPGIMDSLGVRMDTVPAGRTEWPLVASGVDPGQVIEGTAAAAAVNMTFSYANLKPKRLTGRYEFTHEAAATVADLEQAIRRDLADAISSRHVERHHQRLGRRFERPGDGGERARLPVEDRGADRAVRGSGVCRLCREPCGARRRAPRQSRGRGVERDRGCQLHARRQCLSGRFRGVGIGSAHAALGGVHGVQLHPGRGRDSAGSRRQHFPRGRPERRRCDAG